MPPSRKGTAIALALDHAGLDWEGVFIKPGSASRGPYYKGHSDVEFPNSDRRNPTPLSVFQIAAFSIRSMLRGV